MRTQEDQVSVFKKLENRTRARDRKFNGMN